MELGKRIDNGKFIQKEIKTVRTRHHYMRDLEINRYVYDQSLSVFNTVRINLSFIYHLAYKFYLWI